MMWVLMWHQSGKARGASERRAREWVGGQIAIGGLFSSAQPLLIRFPLDRNIFLREYSTATQRTPFLWRFKAQWDGVKFYDVEPW